MDGEQKCESGGMPIFLKYYEAALRHWAAQIEKRIDSDTSIIAISRKGPRLLELLVKYGFIDRRILGKVVVEFATGFQKYRNIILLDDSLIHGSTYLRIRKTIEEINPGIIIYDAPFAVGKTSFLQARELVVCYGMMMREEELDRYIIHITQAFHTLCKPLLTAQPIIELPLEELYERFDPRIVLDRVTKAIRSFASCDSRYTEVVRTVAMLENLEDPCARTFCRKYPIWNVAVPNIVEQRTPGFRYNDIATFKFYLDHDERVLRIVPCTQLSFSLERRANGRADWQESVIDRYMTPLRDFCFDAFPVFKTESPDEIEREERMDEFFRRTHVLPKEGGTPFSEIPPHTLQYLATVHNYLASLQLTTHHRDRLLSIFGTLSQTDREPFRLSVGDLRLLVGNKLSHKHRDVLKEILSSEEEPLRFGAAPVETVEQESFPEQYADQFIRHLAVQRTMLNSGDSDRRDKSEAVEEKLATAFEMYFRRQHYDVEICSRRASVDYRLFFGNNFESLCRIVMDLTEIEEKDRADAEMIVRWQFENNLDTVTVVPYYFIHRRNYPVPLRSRLHDSGRDKVSNHPVRYETVSSLTKMFRVGEGVPYHVRQFYARNLLLNIFSQYFRPKNDRGPVGEPLWTKWFRSYLKLLLNSRFTERCGSPLVFFKEMFSDDKGNEIPLDKNSIPLLLASYQEQLSLCTSDIADELKVLALEMKKMLDEYPVETWNEIRQDWEETTGSYFAKLFQRMT